MKPEERKSTHPAFETEVISKKPTQATFEEDLLLQQEPVTASFEKPIQYDNPSIGPDPRPKTKTETITFTQNDLANNLEVYEYEAKKFPLAQHVEHISAPDVLQSFKDPEGWKANMQKAVETEGYTTTMDALAAGLEGDPNKDEILNYAKETFKYKYSADVKRALVEGQSKTFRKTFGEEFPPTLADLQAEIMRARENGELPPINYAYPSKGLTPEDYAEKYPKAAALFKEYEKRRESIEKTATLTQVLFEVAQRGLGMHTLGHLWNEHFSEEDLPMSVENFNYLVNVQFKNALKLNGIPYRENLETGELQTWTGINNDGSYRWESPRSNFLTSLMIETDNIFGGVFGALGAYKIATKFGGKHPVTLIGAELVGAATGVAITDPFASSLYQEMNLHVPLPAPLQSKFSSYRVMNEGTDELYAGGGIALGFRSIAGLIRRIRSSNIPVLHKNMFQHLTENDPKKAKALKEYLTKGMKAFDIPNPQKPLQIASIDLPRNIKDPEKQHQMREIMLMAIATNSYDLMEQGAAKNFVVQNGAFLNGFVDHYNNLISSVLNSPEAITVMEESLHHLTKNLEGTEKAAKSVVFNTINEVSLRENIQANLNPANYKDLYLIDSILEKLEGTEVHSQVKRLVGKANTLQNERGNNGISLLELYEVISSSNADNKEAIKNNIADYIRKLDFDEVDNLRLRLAFDFMTKTDELVKGENLKATKKFVAQLIAKGSEDKETVRVLRESLLKNLDLSNVGYTNTIWGELSKHLSPEIIETTENQILETLLNKFAITPVLDKQILDYPGFITAIQKMNFMSSQARLIQKTMGDLHDLFDHKNIFHINLPKLAPHLVRTKNDVSTAGGLSREIASRLYYGTIVSVQRHLIRYIPTKTKESQVIGSDAVQTLYQNRLTVNNPTALDEMPLDLPENVKKGLAYFGLDGENMTTSKALSYMYLMKLFTHGKSYDFVAPHGTDYIEATGVYPETLVSSSEILTMDMSSVMSKKAYDMLPENDAQRTSTKAIWELNADGKKLYTPINDGITPQPLRHTFNKFPADCSHYVDVGL